MRKRSLLSISVWNLMRINISACACAAIALIVVEKFIVFKAFFATSCKCIKRRERKRARQKIKIYSLVKIRKFYFHTTWPSSLQFSCKRLIRERIESRETCTKAITSKWQEIQCVGTSVQVAEHNNIC